jgi:non-heme chloroperoxidase
MATPTDQRAGLGQMRTHTITGGGGLRLHVREWGRRNAPPIVFLHGLSQNHQCWVHQYDSPLIDEFRLVGVDLRGHGMSEAPTDPEHYTNAQLWADDLAAIIGELELDRPILVGWSYGAFVICDYLRVHGPAAVGGINFVGGAVRLGESAFGTLIGPGFLDHFADVTSTDLPTSIWGIRGLVRAFSPAPLPAEDLETLLCAAMAVPVAVRVGLASRDLDYDDVLRDLRVPLLVSHGRSDTITLPAMAQHVLDTCPSAEPSWYDQAGHVPHLDDPERFNHELAAFTRRVHT